MGNTAFPQLPWCVAVVLMCDLCMCQCPLLYTLLEIYGERIKGKYF